MFRTCVLFFSLVFVAAARAQPLDAALAEGEQRIVAGQQAQQQVDELSDEAGSLRQQYQAVVRELSGLNTYNSLLQQQLDNQQEEISALRQSITQVAVVERQVVPLMMRMISALDEFIGLDLPFLLSERTDRVSRLRQMMPRADVTVASKLRRVLEAFQIENEYGRTLEAYQGTVEFGGREYEADILRVGRIALLAQTVGGEYGLAWHEGQWHLSDRRYIARGLQMARKQVAPDLLWVPLPPPVEAASGL